MEGHLSCRIHTTVVLLQNEMFNLVIPYYLKLFTAGIRNSFTSRWLHTCLPVPNLDNKKQYLRYSKQRLWSLLAPSSFVGRHFGGTCCHYIMHFYPENGASTFPLNVGTYQPSYMVLHLFLTHNCLAHCVQIFSSHVQQHLTGTLCLRYCKTEYETLDNKSPMWSMRRT